MKNQGPVPRWSVKWYLKRWMLNFSTNSRFQSLVLYAHSLWLHQQISNLFTEFRRHTKPLGSPVKITSMQQPFHQNQNTYFSHCWQTLKHCKTYNLDLWQQRLTWFHNTVQYKVVLVEFYGWVHKAREALPSGSPSYQVDHRCVYLVGLKPGWIADASCFMDTTIEYNTLISALICKVLFCHLWKKGL